MSGGVYEFVVAGAFGPLLRSMLVDLEVRDRHAETRLFLSHADQAQLFAVLSTVVNEDRVVESILLDG